MPLPSFLVVGAAKCGTTSLFYTLNQSPHIFIPRRKECRFFSQMPGDFKGPGADYQNDVIRTFEDYCRLYTNAPEDAVAGDISNDYLYFYEQSITNIKQYLGEGVKILIFLRNPADRAYSHYMHHYQDGDETMSFQEALDDEPRRRAEHWSWTFLYKEPGLYSKPVKAYLEAFENTRVYIFEECWLKNKQQFLQDCFRFIGVEPPDVIQDFKSKVSGKPKSWMVQHMINRLGPVRRAVSPFFEKTIGVQNTVRLRNYLRSLNVTKVPLDREMRTKLVRYFEPDIKDLGNVLGRDMDIWLR